MELREILESRGITPSREIVDLLACDLEYVIHPPKSDLVKFVRSNPNHLVSAFVIDSLQNQTPMKMLIV